MVEKRDDLASFGRAYLRFRGSSLKPGLLDVPLVGFSVWGCSLDFLICNDFPRMTGYQGSRL